jgi:hypothetical protein
MVGELESAPPGEYLAAHAACHGFMNGVDRIAFFGPRDLDGNGAGDEGDDIAHAAHRLLREGGPIDLLVAPGLLDPPACRALVRTFLDWHESAPEAVAETGAPVMLWLDAPRGADVADAIAHREAVGGDRELVKLAVPWVETHTPGRRTFEPLPPSCLIAPLYLGTAATLKGAHTLERRLTYSEQEDLRQSGLGFLVSEGRRRRVRLAFPTPRPRRQSVAEVEPTDLRSRIERALREVCEPLLDGRRNGPALWKTIERQLRAVLVRYQQRGEITAFVCRCDEETNQGLLDGVGVEVFVKVPTRVKELIINVTVRQP